MSKERLQKIKVKLAEIDTHFVVGNHKEAYQGLYELEGQYHIDWLIKQAEEKIQLEERVKELEKENENLKHDFANAKHFKKLFDKQNQRYKQALEEIRNARYEYFLYEYADAVEKIVSQALQGGNDNE